MAHAAKRRLVSNCISAPKPDLRPEPQSAQARLNPGFITVRQSASTKKSGMARKAHFFPRSNAHRAHNRK
jgi:hypothetical protein